MTIQGQQNNAFLRAPLVAHLDACPGKTLGELDWSGVFRKASGKKKVTGIAGNVIEQSVLCLKPNSKQEPDIVVDGCKYEVKTTGVWYGQSANKTELEAKEPVSITAVSPASITSEDYFNSAFWHKIERIIFFYYHYDSTVTVPASEYAKFPLLSYHFHEYDEFSEEERITLERDWTKVRNFIIWLQKNYTDYKAQYPRISHDLRKELMFIDTAPKWPHPPRFRFKRTFVNSIFRQHIEKKSLEQLPDTYTEMRDIEEKCHEIVLRHKGKTLGNLCAEYDVKVTQELKSIAEPIIVKMFGGTKKKMRDIDLFTKIGLLGKSVVLTERGSRTEDTKFFTIDFGEIQDAEVEFEDSQFYDFFANVKILFVVFKEPSLDAPLTQNRFVGFKLITFDENFIEKKVRPVWNRVRELVRGNLLVDEPVLDRCGKQIVNKNGVLRSAPNFPKSSEGDVFIRGTSTDSALKPEKVNGIAMYYQQVWVKGTYIAAMLEEVFAIGGSSL